MYRWVCLLLVMATIVGRSTAQDMCGYKKCSALPVKPGYVNVHLVPHTHDDVGWLKTVDQYYYGANNSIQIAGVQYILDSVIPQLEMKPSRTFIYVEIAFFYRWWREQDADMRERVRKLVNNGQLEFINGGWCMNDEASTHYNAIIDQMTLGLQFLNTTFGECGRPLAAWHIDPFGHSREQASLFAQMGFDGFFFGRLDYQDKANRLKYQNMEEIWRASPDDLGPAADLFTGALYNHYVPPGGLCFDIGCGDQPVEDDMSLHDYNVANRVGIAVNTSLEQAKHFRTDHIMWTMGSDFQYQAAHTWFKNMDKLIAHTNSMENTKVNLLYSSPSCYVYHKNNASAAPPVVKFAHNNTADFFPYADQPHAFWSGYFTSRPAFKGYVRRCNNLLQVCKQLEVIGGPKFSDKVPLPTSERLREAMGVAQHHDAVSGTEKQHVANDYAMRLHAGAVECQVTLLYLLQHDSLLCSFAFQTTRAYQTYIMRIMCLNDLVIVSMTLQQRMAKDSALPPIPEFCNYLNISVCPVTENELIKSFTVTVYNPLARQLTGYYVRLPVNGDAFEVITDPKGINVITQVTKVSPRTQEIRGKRGKATHELVFAVTAPALGFSTYFVSQSSNISREKLPKNEMMTSRPRSLGEDQEIHNEHISVVFDGKTGLLKSVVNLETKVTLKVNQGFYWYNSSAGNNKASSRKSGAYVFRPNSTEAIPIQPEKSVITNVVSGQVVQEVQQMFSPWVSQAVRLYSGQRHVELEWTVGPIPIKDGLGKEIISRFDTDIMSNSTFYTDANGREMLERVVDRRLTWKLNQTEPVAGNYYPVNSRILIKDKSKQLTVLTDRSQGGSGLKNGSLELMVHRRMLYDDGYGVGEPLNETGVFGDGLVVRGKHYLLLDTPESSGQLHRALGEQLYMAPSILLSLAGSISPAQYRKDFHTNFTALKRELPSSVHLLTLEMWEDDTVLMRLENQLQKAEGGTTQNVSLPGLFKTFEVDVDSVEELTLGANFPAANLQRLTWNTESGQTKSEALRCWDAGTTTVSLQPMQICTLRFKLQRNQA
ncbi:PREDICTED: lysosomal alpha-mannosidase-like [Branchiostoma belcheri]|uniref:Alpha-mannosidase n=1 Tax=Branchiostoma belcheri TaxID=7741 RepID=A0A6P4YCD4_BRABE|nr:PREDICTED: lysosomal alpha-mannosidase-like [Branchiostoma belcheri]